jgi:glyoxylase-like metal-dependent hydrolase (beta-lactamase superfamily II)
MEAYVTGNKLLRITLLFTILLALSPASSATATERRITLSENLSVTEFEKDVFVINHSFPWSSNSLLILTSKSDCVLVNTLCDNHGANLLVDWIKNNFGEVNMVAISTGFHVDNLGGNEFLLSKNIAVYGSNLTAKLIAERGQAEKNRLLEGFKSPENKKYYDAYKNLTFVPPNHTFDINEGLHLKIGDEDVNVFYPGPSHTIDNVVVYFPKRKILFGGCMIKSLNSKDAGYTADADMQKWPRSVEKVLSIYKDARIVVPGHGDYGDMALIKYTIELLDRTNAQSAK